MPEVVDVRHFGDIQAEPRVSGAQRKIQVDSPAMSPERLQIQPADGLPALPRQDERGPLDDRNAVDTVESGE